DRGAESGLLRCLSPDTTPRSRRYVAVLNPPVQIPGVRRRCRDDSRRAAARPGRGRGARRLFDGVRVRSMAREASVRRSHIMMSASTFEAVACYYCGGAAATPLLTAEDDLTGRPGRFTFVRCRDCSLVYQSPRLTLETVKTYYESEYIAHRQPGDWGWLAPLFRRAIASLDRDKLGIVDRY